MQALIEHENILRFANAVFSTTKALTISLYRINGLVFVTVNIKFFLNLDCEAIGTAATTGLLCQPRVIVKMIAEKQMECRMAGETEVL
jgi:hypothetical protein